MTGGGGKFGYRINPNPDQPQEVVARKRKARVVKEPLPKEEIKQPVPTMTIPVEGKNVVITIDGARKLWQELDKLFAH